MRRHLVRVAVAAAALPLLAAPLARADDKPPVWVRIDPSQRPPEGETWVACVYLGPNLPGICTDPFAPWR